MVRAYAKVGRPRLSRAGKVPYVAYWSTVPRRLYGLGGHPGRQTTVFPSSIRGTPTASVGFGSADGMPPQEAQEPIAMTAPAFPPISFAISMAVRPPTRQ